MKRSRAPLTNRYDVAHSTRPVDQLGVAPPQELRDRPAHRVADHDRPGPVLELLEQGGDVVGAVGQAEAAAGAEAAPVAPQVGGDHVVALRQRPEGGEPVQAPAGDPAVEQHAPWALPADRRPCARTWCPARAARSAPRSGSGRSRAASCASRPSRPIYGRPSSDAPCDPRRLGLPIADDARLDTAAVDALLARARRDVDDGLLPVVPGGPRARRRGGASTRPSATPPSTPATRSSRPPSRSWRRWSGSSSARACSTRTSRWPTCIPEFGTHGKDAITLEHVLLHTAGFPHAPLGPPRWDTHEGRATAFAEWRLNWDVGTRVRVPPHSARTGCSPSSIHAVTGQDHTDAVRTRVAEPLGLDGFALGVAAGRPGATSPTSCSCGEPATPDELEAALGIREIDRRRGHRRGAAQPQRAGGPGGRPARGRRRVHGRRRRHLLPGPPPRPEGALGPRRARPTSPRWSATPSRTR